MITAGSLRWIPPLQLSGCWQMAIDEWLLDRAVAQSVDRSAPGPMALRFYRWSRPTLSLGFHQRQLEPHWLELMRAGEVQIVRRPSGGRAVLHGGELTYALVWPGAPSQRRQAYRQACGWLQQGFAALGLPLHFGSQGADPQHPSCFASSTAADLVEPSGGKRIGSAQLWRRGVLLQHGSILLQPDRRLWNLVLGEDPPNLSPISSSVDALIERLKQAAHSQLPINAGNWRDAPLTAAEWSAVGARRCRYRLSVGAEGRPLPARFRPRHAAP